MNTKYLIVTAIVAIAIILGSVAAYVYLSQPCSNPNDNFAGCRRNIPLSPA